MKEDHIPEKNSVTTTFKNVTDKISKFTTVDNFARNSVFTTPIMKLAASFLVVMIIAHASYFAGNVVLLLINMSLTQYLIVVSVITVIIFIVMMVAEEDSPTVEIKNEDKVIKEIEPDKKDSKT